MTAPRRLARMSDRDRWRAAFATPEARAFLAWAEEVSREHAALRRAGYASVTDHIRGVTVWVRAADAEALRGMVERGEVILTPRPLPTLAR